MTSVLSVLVSLLILNFNHLLILILMMLLVLVTSEGEPRSRHFEERAVSVCFAADVQVVCSSNTPAMQLIMV